MEITVESKSGSVEISSNTGKSEFVIDTKVNSGYVSSKSEGARATTEIVDQVCSKDVIEESNPNSLSLGDLLNVGLWANAPATSDRILVQLAGAKRWTSKLLSELGSSGSSGTTVLKNYWSKEEIQFLDQYLYVLGEKIKALYADKAGDSLLWAGNLFPDMMDQSVKTDSNVEFKSLIASYLKSKDFASGISGYKAGVDAEFETLKLRKWLEATEYLLNQISLVGDEVILTEGGQIDRVEALENGYYRVILRENSIRTGELKKFDMCMTDFKIETGFRVIKFEITEVIDKGTIIVYPEDPAYPPREMMTFKRFANTVDKTRQNSIRLSARDQIIEMLSGVDSYNPTAKNRDILIGRIRDLLPDLPGVPEFIKQQASAYMQNIILSGTILQTSADGITQQRVPCYKGIWTAEKAPFFYYDQVTDGYVRYTCIYKGEEGTTEEPRFDSDKWEVADGDTALSMKMYSNTGSFEFWDRLDILFDATVKVYSGSKPINDIVNEWGWWIDTGDSEFDTAWKSLHGSRTDTQHVDGTTFPTNMQPGSPVVLWCRATIYNNGKITRNEGFLNL